MNLRPVLLVFLVFAHSAFSQPNRPATREQTDFSTEGEVVHNIPLPGAVRELLRHDAFVRETLLTAGSTPLTSLPEDWTKCSVVHLGNKDERDYIVIGQHWLTGAHATHFWVYRETPQGMNLVLFAFADSLTIDDKRTNGLRNISTLYYTAVSDGTIRYAFNGNMYQSDHLAQYR